MDSDVLPRNPNKQQNSFKRFLCSRLGYDELEADIIYHNLRLHAQHEEDPNCQLSTYPEYFAQEVISKAKKKPQLAVTKEGIDALQAYMNAMPRWTLKGHAPEEIK